MAAIEQVVKVPLRRATAMTKERRNDNNNPCERVVHGRMVYNGVVVVMLLELFQHTQVESDVRGGESSSKFEREEQRSFSLWHIEAYLSTR